MHEYTIFYKSNSGRSGKFKARAFNKFLWLPKGSRTEIHY